MTALSTWFIYRPNRSLDLIAPKIHPSDVTVVVPVRNNQGGLDRLIASLDLLTVSPREIIIVDNLSVPAAHMPRSRHRIRLMNCTTLGAAATRNVGIKSAVSEWIWFLDSDCEVLPSTLSEFCRSQPGPIAFAGRVLSASRKLLGRYYDGQEVLIPQFAEDNEPLYLITASAMIHRGALDVVGCFDESFPSAAGEDIDLGLRLFSRGRLKFASGACVFHHFEECLSDFRKRFARYGQGNRVLEDKYHLSLKPSPFAPYKDTYVARVLARIQYEALTRGYRAAYPLLPRAN